MSYNPSIQVYYCKQSENPGSTHRIAPAPSISISPEIYYANDSIIGYTYTITLSGYANSLRKEVNSGSTDSGVDKTVDHIGDIRDIFNVNGGNLYIKQGNQNLVVAKGATIKNINFNTSDNRWINYSPFTVEIEFNEVDFTGCDNNSTIGCASTFFHSGQTNTDIVSDHLVDMKKYKIKEFNDKWTFTIDNNVYDTFSGLHNGIFKVSYTLSATGKNYYINDKLIPAWQQAKLFVQDRLYKQVNALMTGMLSIESDNQDSCGASKTMSQLHQINDGSGALEGFSAQKDSPSPTHNIYNETISCDTSESNGSFSISYDAIIKKFIPELNIGQNAVLHTYTKDVSMTDQNSPQNVVISVKGNIQGLIRGGFIYFSGNNFELPQTGTFITSKDGNETKYGNAKDFYLEQIGGSSFDDLWDNYKGILGVTHDELFLTNGADIKPASFSVDHNYGQGSISYSAAYDSALISTLYRGFTNITIIHNESVDMIQEFIIPGREDGPIIQKLGMKTPKTISVNIEGATDVNRGCGIDDSCSAYPILGGIDGISTLFTPPEGFIITNEQHNVNKIDGSFSISLEYLCMNN